MLCGVDYPVKPDNDRERECGGNDRRKIMLDNDRGRNGWIMTIIKSAG